MDAPYALTLAASVGPDDGEELTWLLRAARAGVALTPMVVVPVAVEARFYALNNLPERLQRLFDGVDLDDPDEDDLEELAPEAGALVLAHALLDEEIERLYDAFATLPEAVQVRRAGSDGRTARRGRPALLALKRLWAEAWTVERIAARLRAGQGLAPEPAAVLVHDAALERAREHVPFGPAGRALDVWHDAAGRVARLALHGD